jgi:polysaccharide export outer membrane protein
MPFAAILSFRLGLTVLAVLLAPMLLGWGPVSAQRPPLPSAPETSSYRVGTGDRVKVAVFGERDLSGTFAVSAERTISLPLIGEVRVGGMSLRQVENAIVVLLKDGYLKEPQVSVEVVNYRPFYILGEVTRPGSYPYVGNMTVLNAVALGGGYTHRAKKGRVYMTRSDDPEQRERLVKTNEIVQPGDVLRVAERFF